MPWQPQLVRHAHGCGATQLDVQGLTMPGAELTISVSNAAQALAGIGLTPQITSTEALLVTIEGRDGATTVREVVLLPEGLNVQVP
ncbi:MAG: hypothetical protein IPN34_12560 [Planctomycetes bacterium]|nr:hypothetical protein [Planctomycetota bacterium]